MVCTALELMTLLLQPPKSCGCRQASPRPENVSYYRGCQMTLVCSQVGDLSMPHSPPGTQIHIHCINFFTLHNSFSRLGPLSGASLSEKFPRVVQLPSDKCQAAHARCVATVMLTEASE